MNSLLSLSFSRRTESIGALTIVGWDCHCRNEATDGLLEFTPLEAIERIISLTEILFSECRFWNTLWSESFNQPPVLRNHITKWNDKME
jgi:hypothetical protein